MSPRPVSPVIVNLAAALALYALGGLFSTAAQVPAPQQPFGLLVNKWNTSLQQARQVIAQPELTPQQLRQVTGLVETVKQEATAYRGTSTSLLNSRTRELKSLGTVPAEGEPAEAESIVALRKELEENVGFYRARVQQSDVTIARADQALRDLVVVRRQQLERFLYQKGPLPFSLRTWREANEQAREAYAGRFSTQLYAGIQSAREAGYGFGYLLWMLALPTMLLSLGWPIRKWILTRYGRDPTTDSPSYIRRVFAVFLEGLLSGILLSLIPILFFAAIPEEALNEDVDNLATALTISLTFLFIVGQLVKAAFSPDAPQWRIVPIKPEASRILGRRLFTLTAVMSLSVFLGYLSSQATSAYPEFRAVESAIWVTVLSVVLLTLLQRRLWFPDVAHQSGSDEEEPKPHWFRRALPPLLAILIVTVPFIAAWGYVRLADRIIFALTLTGLLIGALLLAREMVGELIEWLLTPTGQRQGVAQKLLTLSDRSGGVLVFWIRTVLNLVVALLGVVGGLLVWGIPPNTLRLWFSSVMEGITVGDLTIGPTQVVFAIFLFVVMMTGTRFLQRWLGNQFLPRTQIHPHVQHSLTAAVGYVGVTLAAVLGIASLGLNVANLALIAGALSVGIGFGLQSIVNNFVSGLILLVERPVSVGDWVIVGGHEGFVKRVNIRSTEIETFTRATVILPNSEILSTAVINYTHRDRYGRIEVPVRIARDSDVEKVRDLLMGCLHRHPLILAWPEPFVLFTDFGESALQFEARGFLADVENSIMVRSELRFLIKRALREAGIEIPYPQRELHFKDAQSLRSERRMPPEDVNPSASQSIEPAASADEVVEFRSRGGGRQSGVESQADIPSEGES